MVSKRTEKILILGGAAVAGLWVLNQFSGAAKEVAGIPAGIQASFSGIVPGIQAGAGALGAGAVNTIGAAGTGLVGGAAGAAYEGFLELTKPFPQPLRTFEPVLEVRRVLTEATAVVPGTDFPVSPQRLTYQENIGVPILTVEEFVKQKTPTTIVLPQALAPQPVSHASPTGQPTSGSYWINPITQGAIAPYVAGQLPAAVSALRAEDIFPAIRGF